MDMHVSMYVRGSFGEIRIYLFPISMDISFFFVFIFLQFYETTNIFKGDLLYCKEEKHMKRDIFVFKMIY